jgi:hypothetical protein
VVIKTMKEKEGGDQDEHEECDVKECVVDVKI